MSRKPRIAHRATRRAFWRWRSRPLRGLPLWVRVAVGVVLLSAGAAAHPSGLQAQMQIEPAQDPTIVAPNSPEAYVTFTVRPDDQNNTRVTLDVSCDGAVTSCSAPPWVDASSASPATVTVTIATSSDGTGTITLTGTDQLTLETEQGGVTVSVESAPPTVGTASGTTQYTAEQVQTNYPDFTVTNRGNTAVQYTLTGNCTGNIISNSQGPTCGSTWTSSSVSPYSSITVPVYYTSGAASSGNGYLTLTATSPYGETASAQVTVVPLSEAVTVNAPGGITTIGQGGATQLPFTIRETGNAGSGFTYADTVSCSGSVVVCVFSATGRDTMSHSPAPGVNQAASVIATAGTTGGSGSVTVTASTTNSWGQTYRGAATQPVNVVSRIAIATPMMNQDDQDMGLCAASCFAVTASRSTAPFFTMDTPRSVTLSYNGDRAFPRPFIYADVSVTNAPAAVQSYTLEVRRNGIDIPFTNGENKLTFQGTGSPATAVRLAGQLDMSSDSTDEYPVTLVVTANYADGTYEIALLNTTIMVINAQRSPIAKGWVIGGVQHLWNTTAGGYLIEEGDGSGMYFPALGVPGPDYSVLTQIGPTTTRTYQDGTQVQFYAGRMTLIVDRFNRQTQVQYDGAGRPSSIIEPMRAGQQSQAPYWSFAYGSYGLSSITEAGTSTPRTTNVTVDASGHLTQVMDPDSRSDSYGYDGSGRLSTVTDRRGNTTQFVYAPSWKLAQLVMPSVPVDNGSGGTTSVQPTVSFSPWQAVGVPTSPTAGSPAPLSVTTAPTGVVISATSDTTSFTVDRWGQPLQTVDPLHRVTTVTRSGLYPIAISYPDGSVDSTTFTNGLLTQARPAGHATTYIHYGAFAQPDSIWGGGTAAQRIFVNSSTGVVDSVWHAGPTPNVARFTYGTLGRVLTVADEAGHTTTYRYDTLWGSVDSVTAPNGWTTQEGFDAHGRDTVSISGVDSAVYTRYDLVNRMTSRFQGVGAASIQLTYDGLFATDVQDRNSNVTHTDFDALGRTTQQCDPTSHCTQFRYDASGRLKSVTNRRGQRINYAYDQLGRLLTKSGDNTTADSFIYSADSRGWSASNGIETDSVRVVPGTSVVGGSDTTITWLYGTRFQVIHGDINSIGARDSTIISTSAPNLTFRKRYLYADPAIGVITSFGDGFNTTAYTYTGDWLQTAKSNVSNENTFYLPTHAPYSTSFSATNLTPLTREDHYDRLGRINQIFTGGSLSASKSGSYYFYDSNGRLAQSQLRTGCTSTTYDTLYQSGYKHEDCSTITTSGTYTYDAEGNRMSQGGTYVTGNRLQTFDGYTFQYDLDGNVLEKTNASTGADYQYTWSSDNRLTDVTMRPEADSSYTTVHFDYNAYGQPVLRTVDSAISARVYDRGQLLLDLNASAGMQRVGEYLYTDGVDQPHAVIVGQTSPSAIEYIEQDVAGDVVGTHDGSVVTGTASYDDWGTPSLGQAMVSRLLWKGLEWDEYTGLYYVRARWYDPAVGRFLSEDPAGFAGGANPYTFANEDPVNGADPSGMLSIGDLIRGVGGFFTGGGSYGGYFGCGTYCKFFSGVLHAPDPRSVIRGSPGPIAGQIPGKLRDADLALTRTPARGGPPNGGQWFVENGDPVYRLYGPDGRASVDYNWGHDHGAGDPHAHDWDWSLNPPRQPGRPIRPGELSSPWPGAQAYIQEFGELISRLLNSPVILMVRPKTTDPACEFYSRCNRTF